MSRFVIGFAGFWLGAMIAGLYLSHQCATDGKMHFNGDDFTCSPKAKDTP